MVAGLDLPQAREDDEGQAQRGGQGRTGLVGAHEVGDVDRPEVLAAQPVHECSCLGPALVGEVGPRRGRVELAADVGVGLAVADEVEAHVTAP